MKEVTVKLLEKAGRALRASEQLLDGGSAEFAAGRAYYAMFYVAEALLNEKGLRFRTHGDVHGAFGKHLIKGGEFDSKYHRWLIEAFNKRITADYLIEPVLTAQNASQMIEQAREFLQEARRHLGMKA